MTHHERRKRREEIRATQCGHSPEELAHMFGVTESYVRTICDFGLEKEEKYVAMREFAVGHTYDEVASEFRVSRQTAYNVCKGLCIRCETKKKVNTLGVVADLQNSDISQNQIAIKYGITRERVRQILQEASKCGIRFERLAVPA